MCGLLTLPVFALLAFTYVHPVVSTLWLGVTTSFAAVGFMLLQWRWNEFKSAEFFVVPLNFFDSSSAVSRFCERFRDGQYSLVSFLFAVLLLTVPPVPSNL